jgi:GTPase SAR1 family protein
LQINKKEIRLQIWDLVGMDTSIAAVNRQFCRNSSGAIFVGDINELSTIESCAEWKNQVEEIMDSNDQIPMLLCGNKCDLLGDNR